MENGKSRLNTEQTSAVPEVDSNTGSVSAPPEGGAEPEAEPSEAEVIERLNAQVADLTSTVLRLRADFDNLRKRADRERSDAFEYATMETLRSLLPIADDFERALGAAPPLEGPAAEYAAGVQLIYQRLLDVLKKLGLEPIGATGKPFDPNLHHAVQKEPCDDCEHDTVIEEYQRGYNFRGKLLRAAMVKVAVKS
jgi:molecular chaperone GrpE